jgi:NAD-dependent dihydropyrimidine dehydrogenase PreA subunit
MHTIYYFSGTGNSMYVALALAERTNAQTKPLLREKDFALEGSVGFVFPVYMNSLPKPVEVFIKKSDFSNVDYLYAVMTHGGVPGKPEHYLNHILSDKNISLDDRHKLEMINNTPKGVAPKILMRLDWEKEITGEKIGEMIRRTDAAIEEIALKVNSRSREFKEETARGKNKASLLGKLLWNIKSSPKLAFYVDNTCSGCGLCETVCLSKRIKVDGKPAWITNDCYYCYACFNFCPQQAIYVRHYEKKKGRYHYPTVTPEQIADQK